MASSISVPQNSFNSGELSPYMHGRTDLAIYRNACAELTNFVPLPQGGVLSRTGTLFRSTLPSVTDQPYYKIIEFAPNSSISFLLILCPDNTIQIYDRNESSFGQPTSAVDTLAHPYLPGELTSVNYDYEVDVIYLTHPNHEPRVIKYEGSSTFSIDTLTNQTDFKAPPFLKDDTSETEVRVSNETYYLKIQSSVSEFSGADVGKYIEQKLSDVWSLYKILGTSDGAPADPTGNTAYVRPITAVVKDIAPEARFALLDNTYPELSISALGAGERELRSDTLVFSYDLEGAYLRVTLGFDKLWSTGVVSSATPVWVKLLEYSGQEDYSIDLMEGTRTFDDFENGQTYRIIDAGTSTSLQFDNAAPAPSAPANPVTRSGSSGTGPDWNNAFRYESDGDTFVATNFFRVNTSGDAGTKVANLSDSQQFDIFKTDPPLTMKTLAGTLTFLDSLTDSVHTVDMTANKDLWVSSDVGRYMMVKHSDSWVTYKIKIFTDARTIVCDVLDIIPTEENSEAFVNDGRSTRFRFSAWSANNYPYTVALYEQRLVFGGWPNNPETISFSKSTDNYDFRTVESDGSVLDTSGITYDLGGRSYNQIQALSAGSVLIIGTASAEWQLRATNFGDPVSPTNIRITSETTIGTKLQMIRVGANVYFVDRSGERFHELFFDLNSNGYKSNDLTLMADHLFQGDPIISFAYQQTPRGTFWFTTESGAIRSLTIDAERSVYAWAKHETLRASEAGKLRPGYVGIMRRGGQKGRDVPYFVFHRKTVDSFNLEALSEEFTDDLSDNFKSHMVTLDSSVRSEYPIGNYESSPITTLSGLDHLIGMEVSVIKDGAYIGDTVLVSGTLDISAVFNRTANKYILVGLKYESNLVLLPFAIQLPDGSSSYIKRGRLTNLGIYLYKSIGLSYGEYGQDLQIVNFHDESPPMDQSPALFTGPKHDFPIDSANNLENKLQIKQTQPYPLNIMAVTPHYNP